VLTEQTMTQLADLKLQGMAEAYHQQRGDNTVAELDFDERFGMLVDAEHRHQHNRGYERRLATAKFRFPHACLENIDFTKRGGPKREQINQLRDCTWIDRRQSIVITGATGLGKSYLACALGNQACRQGYRTLYHYTPTFYRQLLAAGIDGTLGKLLRRQRRFELLVIDDFGLAEAQPSHHRYLLEVIEDRAQVGGLLMTSQYPLDSWHDLITDQTVADAIVDRLIHHAYQFKLTGTSIRDQYGPDGTKQS
jgi:DNA replication protein DnaC